jgi:hypothetical protein
MDVELGVTAIDDIVACATEMVVEEVMDAEAAVIVAVPCPELVARPLLPELLLIMATVALLEVQVTVEVTSCVLPSVYVPVAVNCWAKPRAIAGTCGTIAIDTSAAGFTINGADVFTPPELI